MACPHRTLATIAAAALFDAGDDLQAALLLTHSRIRMNPASWSGTRIYSRCANYRKEDAPFRRIAGGPADAPCVGDEGKLGDTGVEPVTSRV
jgi:hypothetical protein